RWRAERSGCWCGSRASRGSRWRRGRRRSTGKQSREDRGGARPRLEPRTLAAEPLIYGVADLVERAALSREIRSEPGFAHAGAAPGAMVRLEAGEQRAVPEVLGTVAVAVQPVEHRGSGAGRSVGLRGGGGV